MTSPHDAQPEPAGPHLRIIAAYARLLELEKVLPYDSPVNGEAEALNYLAGELGNLARLEEEQGKPITGGLNAELFEKAEERGAAARREAVERVRKLGRTADPEDGA
jgi:hypothetical protein